MAFPEIPLKISILDNTCSLSRSLWVWATSQKSRELTESNFETKEVYASKGESVFSFYNSKL